MVSVSSTSSTNQYILQQLSVQQAKRSADQAELAAQTLKAQANEAQRVADREQGNARYLSIQSDQAQARAGQIRQGLAALNSEQQAITPLSNTLDQVLSRQPAPASTTQTTSPSTSPSPVVNTQGQVTGTIISTKT